MITPRRSRRAPHARRPDRVDRLPLGRFGLDSGWSATCSCGWVGPLRRRAAMATVDYRAHSHLQSVKEEAPNSALSEIIGTWWPDETREGL